MGDQMPKVNPHYEQLRSIAHDAIHRAEVGVRKWGEQDVGTMIVCMTEELGEVARAVLGLWAQVDREGADRLPLLRERTKAVAYEAIDLAGLCLELARMMSRKPPDA